MTVQIVICNRIRLYAEGLQRLLTESNEAWNTRILSQDEIPRNGGTVDADLVITDKPSFTLLAGRARRILLIGDELDSQDLPRDLKEMVEQGLAGILNADTDPALLRKAVQKVQEGELWLDQRSIRTFLFSEEKPDMDVHLSKRETEIMNLICEGFSNRQIAETLRISEPTVKTHCNRLFKKFGVSSRLQLALTVVGDDAHLPSESDPSEKPRSRSGE